MEKDTDNSSRYLRTAPRRQWTIAEDSRLLKLVQEYDFSTLHNRWGEISERFGGGRNMKQCRDRYVHHLHYVTKTPFSLWEEFHLFTLQSHIGNKWCDIAIQLPGRTESSVKNRWYSALRRVQRVGNCSPEAAALIIGQYSLYAAKNPPLGYDEWFKWSQAVLSGKISPEETFEFSPMSAIEATTNNNHSSTSSSTPGDTANHNKNNNNTDNVFDYGSGDKSDAFNPYARVGTSNSSQVLQIRKSQFEDPLLLRLETYVGNRKHLKDFFDDPRFVQLMRLEAETSHLDHDPVHRRARRRRLRSTALVAMHDTVDPDASENTDYSGDDNDNSSFNDNNLTSYQNKSSTSSNSYYNSKPYPDNTGNIQESYLPTEFRSKRGRKTKPNMNEDYVYNPDEYVEDRSINVPPSSSVSKSMFYNEGPKHGMYIGNDNQMSSVSNFPSSSSSSSSSSMHNLFQDNYHAVNSAADNGYDSLPFSVLVSNTNDSNVPSQQQSTASVFNNSNNPFTGVSHRNDENVGSSSSSSMLLKTQPKNHTFDNTTRNSNTLLIPPSAMHTVNHIPPKNNNITNNDYSDSVPSTTNSSISGMPQSTMKMNEKVIPMNNNNSNSSMGLGKGNSNINPAMNMPMNYPMNSMNMSMNYQMPGMNMPMNPSMMMGGGSLGWNNNNNPENMLNTNNPQALLSMQQQYFMQQQMFQQQLLQQQMFLRQQQQQQQAQQQGSSATTSPFSMMGNGLPSMYPFMHPGMMPNHNPMLTAGLMASSMNHMNNNGPFNNYNNGMSSTGMVGFNNNGNLGSNNNNNNNNSMVGNNLPTNDMFRMNNMGMPLLNSSSSGSVYPPNYVPSSVGVPMNQLSTLGSSSSSSLSMNILNPSMLSSNNNNGTPNMLPVKNPSSSEPAHSFMSSSSSSEELLPFAVAVTTTDSSTSTTTTTNNNGPLPPPSVSAILSSSSLVSSSANTLSLSGSYETTLVSSSSSNPSSQISLLNNNSNNFDNANDDFSVQVVTTTPGQEGGQTTESSGPRILSSSNNGGTEVTSATV